MKTKTDKRVTRYLAVTIPHTQHRKLKARAKKRGLRLNAYIPKLLTIAMKAEKHGS
jgi:predicted HicB family RNase H-like nuclease